MVDPEFAAVRVSQVVLLCAVLLAGSPIAAARQAAQSSITPERLYATYLAGDYTAIPRALKTIHDWAALRDRMDRQIGAWKTGDRLALRQGEKWFPSHAAFVLEVGLNVFDLNQREGFDLIASTRELLTLRAPPGVNPEDDALEVAVHRAVVAVLSAVPGVAYVYLNDIEGRVRRLEQTTGGHELIARLKLARAVIPEIRTRPLAADTSGTVGADDAVRGSLREALSSLDGLKAFPELAAEVDVRRGLIWHRLGDQDRALEAIDRAAASTDPVVRYWSSLFRGRVLEALHRPAEAVTAYEGAAAFSPAAQAPLVALAALELTEGHRDSALRWAAAARTTPNQTSDPWWQYWYGDLRFLSDLLLKLRQARP